MGFTIDMITGDISDITNSEKPEKASPTNVAEWESFYNTTEQLLPVSESFKSRPESSVPGSIINQDIDAFLNDVNS